MTSDENSSKENSGSELGVDQARSLAKLCKLSLTESELQTVSPQLNDIVAFVRKLGEVDTDGIEPMVAAGDDPALTRQDVLQESLSRDDALEGAPNHDGEQFSVPPVL